MLEIFVDADGCAVKEETYRVAERHQLIVTLVANKPLNVPLDLRIRMTVVSGGFDAADDWIAEHAGRGDIVITSDILLADRAIKNQARVIGPKGNEFTAENIGNAVGNRELMTHLRQTGEAKGGPAPMGKTDRSQYLAALERVIQAIKKHGA
jgi:uncharacterized protein YaiI (UPF0178 family)